VQISDLEEEETEKKLSRQERERIQLVQTVTQHAEDLFRQNGYENTTTDALAASSEYTKRTIYRYFVSKEDLYFAVMLKGHERLLRTIQGEIQSGQTGYEKIRMAYQAFFDFFMKNGWLFDLMAQIKSIKSKRNPNELPYFEKYANCVELIYKEIIALFVMAHGDKSIRIDIDPKQLGFSSAFILNGFFHMLGLSGDSFTRHFTLDKEQFIDLTMKLLFQILEGEKQ
jgi:AcrR family transcriptional regulator